MNLIREGESAASNRSVMVSHYPSQAKKSPFHECVDAIYVGTATVKSGDYYKAKLELRRFIPKDCPNMKEEVLKEEGVFIIPDLIDCK